MMYVVADDHPATAEVIGKLLQDQFGTEVGSIQFATNGPQLLDLINQYAGKSTLLTLDLAMPGQPKRLSLLRTALAIDPSLRVVVFSGYEGAFLAEAAINEGALAYVNKSSLKSVLLQAIRSARNGISFIDPNVDIARNAQSDWRTLTERETWIVLQLCTGTRMKDLAASTGLKYATLAEYRQGAMRKLGVREVAGLSTYLTQHGLGYLLDE